MTPFDYRPESSEDEDWADNWLSNSLAYLSDRFIPKWCQNGDHWTVRITLYLWADCACCLFFRGVTAGVSLAASVAALIYLVS
jgi:hypothetical protein